MAFHYWTFEKEKEFAELASILVKQAKSGDNEEYLTSIRDALPTPTPPLIIGKCCRLF